MSHLAATLYRLLTQVPAPIPKAEADELEEMARLDALVLENASPDRFLERGKMQLRVGAFLRGLGDLTRALEGDPRTFPEAYHHRSRAFFLLGRPLYALDDLAMCPKEHEYPASYVLYRVALLTLVKQIVAAAETRGLPEYARLFTRRLDKLNN